MTKKELIEKLEDYPDDVDIEVAWSESTCDGHGPGEYCYCGYEDKNEDFIIHELMEPRRRVGEKTLRVKKLLLKAC